MNTKAPIESLIIEVRGLKVVLAADLASLYGVETKRLNEQVRRNADRFPNDFCFQLTANEKGELEASGRISSDGRAALRSQIATLKRGRHAKYPPLAFTEHGAIMTPLKNASCSPRITYVMHPKFQRSRIQLMMSCRIPNWFSEFSAQSELTRS